MMNQWSARPRDQRVRSYAPPDPTALLAPRVLAPCVRSNDFSPTEKISGVRRVYNARRIKGLITLPI